MLFSEWVTLRAVCGGRGWLTVTCVVRRLQHQSIEAVLERGVKLDDLVKRSEDLSSRSKLFYDQAKVRTALSSPMPAALHDFVCPVSVWACTED